MVSEELVGSGHTGRAPHPQLLWAYSGGGAGQVGGAGPTLWPAQSSIPRPHKQLTSQPGVERAIQTGPQLGSGKPLT